MIIPAELIFKELITLEFYCLSLLVLPEAPDRRGGGAGAAGEGGHQGSAPGLGTAPSGFLGDKFVAKTAILPSRKVPGALGALPAPLDPLRGTATPGGSREGPFAQGVKGCTEGFVCGISQCCPEPRGLGLSGGVLGVVSASCRLLQRWEGALWMCSRRGASAQQ